MTPLRETGIPGNAKDPRPDSLRLAQTIQMLEYAQQRILSHFFGILSLAAHQPAIVKNLGPEMLDKCIEGSGISRQHIPGQFGLLFPGHA